MRKLLLGIVISLVCSAAFAAPECDETWENSSAAGTCGYVCSNPNGSNMSYGSTYDPFENECKFHAGCCNGTVACGYNGLPSCINNTNFIVSRGDSKFYNKKGTLKKDKPIPSSNSSLHKTTRSVK